MQQRRRALPARQGQEWSLDRGRGCGRPVMARLVSQDGWKIEQLPRGPSCPRSTLSIDVTYGRAVISRVRKAIAVAVAIFVTVLTLGRVRANWTGGSSGAAGAEDPGRPSVARLHEPSHPRVGRDAADRGGGRSPQRRRWPARRLLDPCHELAGPGDAKGVQGGSLVFRGVPVHLGMA
jgi:hypothetical protein